MPFTSMQPPSIAQYRGEMLSKMEKLGPAAIAPGKNKNGKIYIGRYTYHEFDLMECKKVLEFYFPLKNQTQSFPLAFLRQAFVSLNSGGHMTSFKT